jgi:predicted TIM-barrel fold metal-dependent hydrolase
MFHFAFLTLPVVAAFTSLLQGGTLDRFPRLKIAILESGGGWIAHWLERLDGKYGLVKAYTPLSMRPSEYFQRQCWISVEPDEGTIPMMVELLGSDRFIWASDYPHVDASLGAVKTLKERIASLPGEVQRKILGRNAARLYELG